LALELALRLSGFGDPVHFFVPWDRDTVTTNRRFLQRFAGYESALSPCPVLLPVHKPASTRRIVVLGESAAQGSPAPAFGFARILEVMLQQQYPGHRFEVLNAAVRGVNSHVVLPIARDCADYSPDLFLVYMGNNEAAGLYAPEPEGPNITPYRHLLQWRQSLNGTRLAQGFHRLAHRLFQPDPKLEQDMEFFRRHRLRADDPRRAAVYDNFRANLGDLCSVAQRANTRVILSTVAVNLGDFPPLASLNRVGLTPAQLEQWRSYFSRGATNETLGRFAEAITNYLAAKTLDDHHAELHFRLGRCLRASGGFDQARQSFALARDWDALQFRTDHRLNQITREIAAARQNAGVVFIDAEHAIAEAADPEHGIPGSRLFHDHVHLTFDGDYALASAFLPAVAKALNLGESAQNQHLPTRTQCAEALGLSAWDELGLATAIARSTAKAPFLDQLDHARRQTTIEAELRERTDKFQQPNDFQSCLDLYRNALTRRPNDWQVRHNYGNLLTDFGQHARAVPEFTAAVRAMPAFPPLRVALARALWTAGKREDAIKQLEAALRLDSRYGPARDALAQLQP